MKDLVLIGIALMLLQSAAKAEVVEDDIWWYGEAAKNNKPGILKMLNQLAAEHPRCKQRLSPSGFGTSKDKSAADNPVFFVHCGAGDAPEVVFFSLADINSGTMPGAKQTIGQGDAFVACKHAAEQRAANPSSVSVSMFASNYTDYGNGNASVATTFTAKNGFGVEQTFKIYCGFEGERLETVSVK